MTNPYTSETPFSIGGKECTLVFDWRALAGIHADCGGEAVRNLFNYSVVWTQSPDVYAKMVYWGLRAKHAEITLDDVYAGLPPFAKVIEVLTQALMASYFGNDKPEGGEAEESKKKAIP